MSGFADAILGGVQKLIRKAIQSPNYVAGVSGWSINKDGSAEFNNVVVRGNVVISSNGQEVFVYTGTPAAGNLLLSIAGQSGTDAYGNTYAAGLELNWLGGSAPPPITLGDQTGNAAFTANGSMKIGTMIGTRGYIALEPPAYNNENVGVTIDFLRIFRNTGDHLITAEAGYFLGDQNIVESTKINNPAGGYTNNGSFHEFVTTDWPYLTLNVPPSGGVEIEVFFTGFNSSGATFSVSVGFDIFQGATQVFTASLSYAAQVAGTVNDAVYAKFPIGQDILDAYIGQPITVRPAYRGTNAGNLTINAGRMYARPLTYTLLHT